MHWYQNCNFWKNTLSQGRRGQTTSKPKTTKILNKNLEKLDEIQNLASATSKMTSWPQRPRKGLSEFFQKLHFLNQCIKLRKMSYCSAFWSDFYKYQFLTLCPPRPKRHDRTKSKKLVFVKVWPESRAIAHFSQFDALILRMSVLKKITEPLPRSLRSRGHFRGHWGQTLDFI